MIIKKILVASIILNILIISAYVYKTQRRPKKIELTEQQTVFSTTRKQVFELLPIDSCDVVFLGNSITEGFPVGELFGAKNRGVSSNRAFQVLDRIGQVKKAKKVFLMIGINDIKDKTPLNQLLKITGIILDSLKGKVVVQSVLPASGIYQPLNENIVKYNQLLKEHCTINNIPFVDLHTSFKGFDQYSYDGLHLNAKGYQLWKDLIKRLIK